MLTTQQYIDDLLKQQNLALIKQSLSSVIQSKLPTLGSDLFSLSELKSFPFIFDTSANTALVDADLVGIFIFDNLQQLILSSSASLTRAGLDVSRFQNLKVLKNMSGLDSKIRGDLSGLTKLVSLLLTIDVSTSYPLITPPVLSNNTNLEDVRISSLAGFNWPVSSVGNLQNLTKLKSFQLVNCSTIDQATINNILSSLKTGKQNGSPLTSINMTGSRAPTGGSANADYLALVAAGVTVTLGTA